VRARPNIMQLEDILGQSDIQADTLVAAGAEEQQALMLLSVHMKDFGVASDGHRLAQLAKLRCSTNRHWSESIEAVLNTGRDLIKTENLLTKAEFDHYIADAKDESGERILRFKANMAFKVMAFAKAFDSGRFHKAVGPTFHIGMLPPITTSYLLQTLADEQLKNAAAENLIRADVTRREIEGYLRVIRPKKTFDSSALDAAALKTRRAALERRRKKLVSDLSEIDEELISIGNRLRGGTHRPCGLGAAEFFHIGAR
jgi:hypothetical protein